MIPDLETILVDHLDGIGRVVTKTPDNITPGWVRVTQLDAAQDAGSTFDHLTSYLVQCDCYAGKTEGSVQASALARQVRAAIVEDLPGVHDDAVVTGARITGHARLPDTDLEPARERYVVTAEIWAHAA